MDSGRQSLADRKIDDRKIDDRKIGDRKIGDRKIGDRKMTGSSLLTLLVPKLCLGTRLMVDFAVYSQELHQ
jgi:hypothetical protein